MSNNPFSPRPRDSGIGFDVNSVAPPPGPPPPKVPKGWLARWDPNYKTFYYVNLATKQSQWEPPTEEVEAEPATASKSPLPSANTADPDPPSYSESTIVPKIVEPNNNYSYGSMSSSSTPYTPELNQSSSSDYLRAPSPNRSRSRSLGSKISKFIKSHSNSPMMGGGRPRYYTPPPSQYYGVAHPQPTYPTPMMAQPMIRGGAMMGGQRRGGGGIGPGGMMGLGLGGGLLGGMLLSDAIHDNEMDAYQEGFSDGADYDADFDGGGDFDGGDFGDFGDF